MSSSSSTSASSTPALIAQSHRATWNLRDRMTISLVGTIVVTTILFLVSTPAWHVYMVDFWMYDLPPLRPEVRIAAYLGIFLIAWFSYFARPPFGDSPLQAPELYAYTLPSFFSLEGVMAVVGKRWLSVPLLHVLRAAVIASMFCCMIGFGGHYPPIIAGLGTLVLHGVVQGCIGTSHRWYVPVYSLFALMFANGNQYWSVDALLASHLPPGTYPFAPYTEHALPSDANFAPVLVSGFARKYILVLSIFTLFFGGITKFLNSGVAWMNGNSLAYYVSSDENGRSMLLKDIMHRFRSLSLLLSFASIVLELGAIAAVFSTLLRPIILASAAAFHFGIWLTMWPNYFPQTYCYGLGQSWFEQPAMNHLWTLGLPADPALASRTTMLQHLLGGSSSSSSLLAAGVNATTAFGAHAGAAAAAASAASLSVAAGSLPDYVSSTMFAATAFATVSCIFLSFVTMLRIEYWPFTGVPMYSFYRDYSYNYKFLRDAKQAQEVALEHMLSGYPNALAWSNLWVVLRLKNVDPVVQRDQEEKRKQRAAAAAAAGAGSDAQIKATLAQSDAEKKENKESSERLFVNLKNRATNMSLPHGVLSKQWRRTLHNIAAKDMAMKPFGRIEADDATESVGTQWLREQRDALRQAGWALPEWADRSGELQLRVKLTEGYAVLAKVPWDPKLDKGAETKKQQ